MTDQIQFHTTSLNHNGWCEIHAHLSNLRKTRTEKANGMTKIQKLVKHLNKTGSISHLEAMNDYQMSGGSLTKYISVLRHAHRMNIMSIRKTHPITGNSYTRYTLNANANG